MTPPTDSLHPRGLSVCSAFLSKHPPRFEGFPHDEVEFLPHEHFLILAMKGTRDIRFQDGTIQAPPHSIRFHPKGMACVLDTRQSYEEIAIAFTHRQGPGPAPAEAPLRIPRVLLLETNPLPKQICKQILQLAPASSPALVLRRDALLMLLISEVAERATGESAGIKDKMDAVIQQMEGDIAGNPNLDALATSVGMSRRSLIRHFKHETGRSLVQFLLERRVALAKGMLRSDPGLGNRQIADHLGFYDEYHFGHIFKKVTGTSPRRFKNAPGFRQ